MLPTIAFGECLPVSHVEFETQVSKLSASKLVFFASWCPPCKEHLLAYKDKDVILIASFDVKENADSALKALSMQDKKCFFDQKSEVAKAYQVLETPAVRNKK